MSRWKRRFIRQLHVFTKEIGFCELFLYVCRLNPTTPSAPAYSGDPSGARKSKPSWVRPFRKSALMPNRSVTSSWSVTSTMHDCAHAGAAVEATASSGVRKAAFAFTGHPGSSSCRSRALHCLPRWDRRDASRSARFFRRASRYESLRRTRRPMLSDRRPQPAYRARIGR